MRLAHHFLLWVLAIVGLVLIATTALHIRHAREYLSDQLSAHAQDTATALALSLSGNAQARSPGALQSLVDAIADAGYYEVLEVVDASGHTLASKPTPIKVAGVPAWFLRWAELQSPLCEAPVTEGWRFAGLVRVQSHPGYAYKRLWLDLRAQAVLLAGGGIVLALVSLLLIRLTLRPLNALEAQAHDIAEGDFKSVDVRPWTRDLARIVAAMNYMSRKVETMLQEKIQLIERIEQQALRDGVTGLLKREHFEARADGLLQRAAAGACHALIIVRLSDLGEYNTRVGFASGSRVLRGAAEAMQAWATRFEDCLLGRCAGDQIVALLAAHSEDEVSQACAQLLQDLAGIAPASEAVEGAPGIEQLHIGAALQCGGGATLSSLFARADLALRRAESAAAIGVHVYGPEAVPDALACGASAWGSRLREAIAGGEIILLREPVASVVDRKILQHEIVARLAAPDGSWVPAAVYLPMAQRLGLAGALDRAIVAAATGRIETGAADMPRFAINLSGATLAEPESVDAIVRQLEVHASLRERLCFELTEFSLLRNPHDVQRLASRLKALHVPLGIDHAGRDPAALPLIKTLRPAYLKLHPDFPTGLWREPVQRVVLQGLVQLAHALDCLTIATAVETDAEFEAIAALGCDAAQGRLIGKAQPLQGAERDG